MIFTKSNGIMTAAIMLSLSATVSTFAQQIPEPPGIMRISARPIESGAQSPGGPQVEQTSAFGHHLGNHQGRTIYVDGSNPGYAAGGYSNGNCPTGNCPTGNGSGNYGNYQSGGACPSGQCPHCRGARGCRGCRFCEHYCKHSPGYGYAPPTKYPLQRRGVEYTHFYPAQWYGAGADYSHSTAPMVYQPTDTTQLGFYYQHVPFWQPQPNMLPERPIPAQWNIKAPAYSASNWYGDMGYNGYAYGNGGYAGVNVHNVHHHGMRSYSNGYDMNGSCPVNGGVNNPTPSPQVAAPPAQPVPTPVTPEALPMNPDASDEGSEPNTLPPTSSVPPSPTNGAPTTSATSGHIRRSGFQN